MNSRRFVAFLLLSLVCHCSIANAEQPHWLWSKNRDARSVEIRTTIELTSAVEKVGVWIGVDFCDARLLVNGKTIDSVEAYGASPTIYRSNAWKVGQNQITIQARGRSGPSALAVAIDARYRNGKSQRWQSSSRWQDKLRLKSYGQVSLARFNRNSHSIEVDSFDDYTQWKQASGSGKVGDPSKFVTAAGFTIELVRPAKKTEGSWISLEFDPQGRLLVSREDQGIWRMTLSKSGSAVRSLQLVNRDLKECRGLLFAHGSLYASANNSKGLYRLSDTNNDGKFNEVKLLRSLAGGVGHGRNDLTLGPDGKIYWICGDSVKIPRNLITDPTSPLREHRQKKDTSEGFVVRTDRDGKSWEVVAAGLRNPYGVAFNSQGDLFTYDADAEFDMGSPWYRPTRVVQIVRGGDYGWRGVTGRWPPYYCDHPDNGLPVFDIGKGSPTAVRFGQGKQFPAPYNRALFILDWAYGRIIAVHCVPRGASYVCRAETFVKGRPFNVTDLTFAPDGSMYVITGGRGTRSALYRIKFHGQSGVALPKSSQQLGREKFSTARRAVRRRLESNLLNPSKKVLAESTGHLSDEDPWIRYAARQNLERFSIKWQAGGNRNPLLRLARLMTSVRQQSLRVDDLATELERLELHRLSPTSQQMALHVCQLALTKQVPSETARRSLVTTLGKAFPSRVLPRRRAADIDRVTAELLLKLAPKQYTPKVVALLQKSHPQADLMHYQFILRDVREGWTLADRRSYFTSLQATSLFRGGQGLPGFLKSIRNDAVAHLSKEVKKELGSLLLNKSFQFQTISKSRKIVKAWVTNDLSEKLKLSGNPLKGKTIFREALCVNCHRKGSFGFPVGPDLSSVSSRFGRLDMLRSILEPSRVVAENYRAVQVVTTKGRIHSGRVVTAGDYRLPTLRINTNPLDFSEVVNIPKNEIQSYRRLPISPMPKGLLDRFTPEEILDLLAFLESRP